MSTVAKAMPWLVMNATKSLTSRDACADLNPTYSHRVDDPDSYNFCAVPDSGQDAIVYGALALVLSCLLQGRLSALWVFIAGGLLQLLNTGCNMGALSNGATLWLGIEPADIFLYVFLPPLLLDSVVRIDYFTFKKVMIPVLTYAFLVVLTSTLMMIPVMLYALDLTSMGWRWQHAAVFTSMISSTDAVAVAAILHSGGASAAMSALLEGESLFNDATSITLFEIFLQLVRDFEQGSPELSVWETSYMVSYHILKLAVGGSLIGLACGMITRWLLKLMQRFGSSPPQELSITLGMAYMAFFIANSPQIAGTSGVIAVVAMGLYGSATGKWDMSPRVAMSNVFYSFWDSIQFIINGVVFFFAGSSAVNFFIRSSQELEEDGAVQALFETFWRMPLIYIAMFVVRGLSIAMFKPLFDLLGQGMSWGVVSFTTLVGLRGAVSLILAQILVLDQERKMVASRQITAQMALWTAGFVVLTLAVNAPLVPWLLQVTGVAENSPVKRRMRSKAARALVNYTQSAIEDLKHDEDEMLRGVDWSMVEHYVDISAELPDFEPDATSDDSYGGTSQDHSHTWAERIGIAQAAAWTQQRLENMLGRRRSNDLDGLPHWADDTDGPHDRHSTESRGFMTPLLTRVNPESTIVESNIDGSVHSIVTEGGGSRNPRPVAAASGPGGTGTTVAQPWPNDLAVLEQAHGRCTDDLPFMAGSETSNLKRNTSQNGRAGQSKPSDRSKDLLPAALAAAGGKDGVADLADALPAEVPPSADSVKNPSTQWGAVADDPIINPQTADWENNPQAAETAGGRVYPVERQGSERGGNSSYTVLPQPVLVPGLRSTGSNSGDGGTDPKPSVNWMAVDVRAMRYGRSLSPSDNMRRGISQSSSLEKTGDLEDGLRASSVDSRPSRKGLLSGGLSLVCEGNSDSDSKGPDPDLATSLHRSMRRSRTSSTGDAEPTQSRQTSSPGSKDTPIQQAFHTFNTHEPGIAEPQPAGSVSSHQQDIADEQEKELTTEARLRLLSGLKRYFHQKRSEGLLSNGGMIILDYACDNAMDSADQPLDCWTTIEKEVAGGRRVKFLVWSLFKLSLLNNWLRGTNVPLVRYVLDLPRRVAASWLNSQVSSVMLVSIESAVEFWLALSWSPQAQWLRYSDPSGDLLSEVAAQSKSAWKFIIEREIEAPDRFQAIQSYRAAMAIMRQQARFIEQLYESGMVDETEKEGLTEPVEARERTLSRFGAVWRSPRLLDILKGLPFFANAPSTLFDRVLAAGQLIMYTAGDVVFRPPPSANEKLRRSKGTEEGHDGREATSQGIFVVLHGIVRSAYVAPDGTASEYFLGRGGIFGLLPALVGESLPGARAVIAEGNLLRRGPVVFRLPPEALEAIHADADNGDEASDQLMLDMYRVASLWMAERMRSEVVSTVAAQYQYLRLTTARRAIAKQARHLAHKAVHEAERARFRAGKDKVRQGDRGSAMERCRTFLESEFGEGTTPLKDGVKAAKKGKGYKPSASPVPSGGTSSPFGTAANVAQAEGLGSGLACAAAAAFAAASDSSKHGTTSARRSSFQGSIDKQSDGGPGARGGTDWSTIGHIPTDEELLAEMDPNEMWRDIQDHASKVLASLKHGLRQAEVLELPAGAVVKQRSSLVVLRGTLRVSVAAKDPPVVSPHSDDEQKKHSGGGSKGHDDSEALVVYRAPCILPWLWDMAAPAAGLVPELVHLVAGHAGAIVAKCPTEDGDSTASEDSHSLHDGEGASLPVAVEGTAAAARTSGGQGSPSTYSTDSFTHVSASAGGGNGTDVTDGKAGDRGDGGSTPGQAPFSSGNAGGSTATAFARASKKASFAVVPADASCSNSVDAADEKIRKPVTLRRRASMQRLPSVANISTDAGELSSFASGTGKSSSERMQVVNLKKSRSVARLAGDTVPEDDSDEAHPDQN